MIYIEMDGNKYPCKIHSFMTQFGKDALRVISSEAPVAENGFRIVNDNDDIITDRSDYKYLYRENGDAKEYVAAPEEIVPVKGYYNGNQSESPYTILSRQIGAVSTQVNAITPYTESRLVGYQDKECVFTNIHKDGVLTATVLTEDGEYVPNTVERIDDFVRVSFEELDTVATVTIQIQ